MKKSYIKVLLLEFLIVNLITLNLFTFKIFKAYNLSYFFLWILLDVILIKLIGYEKDKSLYKIDILQIIFVYSFIFFIIVWATGLYFGFTNNPYSLKIMNIIKNSVPVFIIIFLQEIFRYTVIKKCNQSELVIIITNLFLSFCTIALNIKAYDLSNTMGFFELFGLLIIPTLFDNCLLSFITLKSGFKPAILYRIILEIVTVYMIPIQPNVGPYINSILKIIFPTLLYLRLNNLLVLPKFSKAKRKTVTRNFANALTLIFVIVIVALVSGIFKYSFMAVGSNSMYPKIKKGDAVIVEKTKVYSNIKIGDVLVYRHEGKVIVHRIYKIRKENETYIFNTKGDNNDSADNWDIIQSGVIGIAKVKIPYIGYPSVWLSELF